MLSEFSLIALFIIIVLGFSISLVLIPVALRKPGIVPHNPSDVKSAPYECGLDTIGPTWIQFKIRYYFYALLLITLDVVIIFIFPWAVELHNLGASSFWPVVSFLAIVGTGYVYAWRKGALEWK